MDDLTLAHEVVRRLNELLESPGMGQHLADLMRARISTGSDMLANHPTVQVSAPPDVELGWLGLLNGIVGAKPCDGWGFIGAQLDDCEAGPITRFQVNQPLAPKTASQDAPGREISARP